MSASAFAPWSCCLKKLGTPRRRRDLDTTEPTTVTISTHRRHDRPPRPLQQKESSRLSRRLVIELGFCLGLVDAFIQQPREGFAAESQCELTLAPSGLAYCDRVVGTGPEATKGQLIKAHYVGKLENGKVFDSSYNRGKPLTFRVGVGEVIKGWDQGILGGDGIPPMFAGGKRTLKLPPELGYGMRGAGCKGGSCIIPPDSILLFDVEFIGKA
ncbi:PREDICTED: peptidyl-prolyl cis-trans isomerase FKBP13, chloroplastic-like isoform X1 [Nelumbo nucifera]|uniref:peptidylprolyl isomerase n=1 Tax=Nelumbo nucifera TaxID=4432 RepID=A0A1U8A6Y9_NELNU|nr:PREDICTED: peptidyl-prolyl cis-trans isomerase FKBP13, chloroplastic-like isoform X1 [Nelumbo nucifera]